MWIVINGANNGKCARILDNMLLRRWLLNLTAKMKFKKMKRG
ncbi:hypothetical protein UNSWCS_1304 [Campylobacter concisus UNSWCS]|uniref:Uncharacterized protein n=1 Tax=Campylobacter concisus UNSWCS TaxID=1242968 RepID=U2ESL6_9BACT|nr:hypothetical protein [Campylobacter concisus]ERJ27116.1 hypothetical protein UNSWCS_1304 [Campylobacter concisus UNSWCS]